jgi:AICAR transformylase/IMP cyclohydrolase PurH
MKLVLFCHSQNNPQFNNRRTLYCRVDEPVGGRVPKLFINIDELLLRASGNFEEQYKVSETYIIIINYIIINAYYNM